MNAVCVDDEAQVLKHIVSSCRMIHLLDNVRGFTNTAAALNWIAEHPVDLALLDIDMPGMSGLQLAEKIRDISSHTSIIFITAFSEYALDAFDVHPSGYLLKPFDQQKLVKEVEWALSIQTSKETSHIIVKTFGHFEIMVNGKTLNFRRSKSKELLAYLVDRRGSGISRQDAFSALWENRPYDIRMQKQMDVVIRSLRDTLQQYGIGHLFELKNRNLRILPELIDCDFYHFLDGETESIHSFFGEYMSQYTWASNTEAWLASAQSKNTVDREAHS